MQSKITKYKIPNLSSEFLNLFGLGEIDGDICQPKNIVGKAHHIDKYKKVDQTCLFITGCKKIILERFTYLSFLFYNGTNHLIYNLPFFIRESSCTQQQCFVFLPAVLY